ncbi:MAG: hypothetical protein HY042_00180 [Spirochaetia bacterium]|nr:hypothetical protein [Spirochaetia bacterium]
MIRFSRFKGSFMLSSVLIIAVLFGITYGKHGGFARSITFNGGIRFSINMPAGTGKAELEAAAHKSGLTDYTARLTSQRANQYDLELGPDVRDKYAKIIEQKEKAEKGRKDSKADAHSITSEIEKVLTSSRAFLCSPPF